MDVFRFKNPSSKTKMEHGELVQGLTSKMWVERYADAGEFTFVGPARKGIRESLPVGSLVSHTDTEEIMIVENHELNGKKGEDVDVTVTGRSFETFSENRVVGSNQKFPVTEIKDFTLPDNHYSWTHIVDLINAHILSSELVNPDDALPYVLASHTVTGGSPTGLIPLSLQRGSLYEHIQTLLKIDNLGIKSVRPGTIDPVNTTLVIHRGVDRSQELVLSYTTGEIENIDYLFSNKKLKNAALVTGTWVEFIVEGPETGYDRRMMFVSASDIDQVLTEPPTGFGLDLVVLALWLRGMKAIKEQNEIALKKAEVSKDAIKFKYRKDYDLGDLIGVSGGFLTSQDEPTKMRIVEYVEIEDENGQTGYPTLTVDPSVEQPMGETPIDPPHIE